MQGVLTYPLECPQGPWRWAWSGFCSTPWGGEGQGGEAPFWAVSGRFWAQILMKPMEFVISEMEP